MRTVQSGVESKLWKRFKRRRQMPQGCVGSYSICFLLRQPRRPGRRFVRSWQVNSQRVLTPPAKPLSTREWMAGVVDIGLVNFRLQDFSFAVLIFSVERERFKPPHPKALRSPENTVQYRSPGTKIRRKIRSPGTWGPALDLRRRFSSARNPGKNGRIFTPVSTPQYEMSWLSGGGRESRKKPAPPLRLRCSR